MVHGGEEIMDQTLHGEVRWQPEHEVPGVRLNHLTSDLEVLAVTAGPEPRFPPVFLLASVSAELPPLAN